MILNIFLGIVIAQFITLVRNQQKYLYDFMEGIWEGKSLIETFRMKFCITNNEIVFMIMIIFIVLGKVKRISEIHQDRV